MTHEKNGGFDKNDGNSTVTIGIHGETHKGHNGEPECNGRYESFL